MAAPDEELVDEELVDEELERDRAARRAAAYDPATDVDPSGPWGAP